MGVVKFAASDEDELSLCLDFVASPNIEAKEGEGELIDGWFAGVPDDSLKSSSRPSDDGSLAS